MATSTNLNTNRGYSFSFITSQTIELTELLINAGHINGSGTDQAFVSDLNWSFSSGLVGSISLLMLGLSGPALLRRRRN